jgi:hypothetical protein
MFLLGCRACGQVVWLYRTQLVHLQHGVASRWRLLPALLLHGWRHHHIPGGEECWLWPLDQTSFKTKGTVVLLSDQIVRKVVHIIHTYIHTNSHPPHWLDRGGGRRKKGWGGGGGHPSWSYLKQTIHTILISSKNERQNLHTILIDRDLFSVMSPSPSLIFS